MDDIKTYSLDDLKTILNNLSQPSFRAKQLYSWLHDKNCSSYDEMTNLPLSLRQQLQELYPLHSSCLADLQKASDGTQKLLLELSDGELVETVGILFGSDFSSSRLTVCVSSQVGCSLGCLFCATGKEGFKRNLTASEMIDQIQAVQDHTGQRVSNIVFMGQGEPFLNYDNLIDALHRINHDECFLIGARKITVSTSGIIAGIQKFIAEPEQFRLAVSLHSARQATRNILMPRLAQQPLPELKKVLVDYTEQRGRRTTLEYLLIQGINDVPEELDALIEFCRGINCHVNLLSLNPISQSDLLPSESRVVDIWEERLLQTGIPVSRRRSKGSDIAGACGQLKNSYQ